MQKSMLATVLLVAALAPAAHAADMLPLKQGIYVPANRPCKGASRAEIVSYWGGKSSFNSAQTSCTINKLTRNGKIFTITDKCADIRAGGRSDQCCCIACIAKASPSPHAIQAICASVSRSGRRRCNCGSRSATAM